MKIVSFVALVVGLVCVVLAVYSRITLQSLQILPTGTKAITLLQAANTSFLAAIALKLASCKKK